MKQIVTSDATAQSKYEKIKLGAAGTLAGNYFKRYQDSKMAADLKMISPNQPWGYGLA